MKLTATLSAAALAVSTSIAFAGSIAAPTIEEAPMAPVTPASDWTGFYGGLQYGWAAEDDSFDNLDGSGYGLHIGYMRDFDKIVVGGELDYNWLDVSSGGTSYDEKLWRIKALAGYDAGRLLPYLTIGYANLDLDSWTSDNGISYGLGGIYKVTDTIGLGLEYTHTQVDNFDGSGDDVDVDLVQLRASYHF